MIETHLDEILERSPISKRHKALLIESGLSQESIARVGLGTFAPCAAALKDLGLPSDLPAGLLLPVRNTRGGLATLRLFPDPSILVRPPIDLGRFDTALRQSVDHGVGFEYLAVPFVAEPAVVARPDLVLLVDDDLAALILADRLRVRVVSSCGDRMPGLAARVAAELPGVKRVLLVPDSVRGDADTSYRFKLAALGTFGVDVQVARWRARTAIKAVNPARLLTKTVAPTRPMKPAAGGVRHGGLLPPPLSLRDRVDLAVTTTLLGGLSRLTDVINFLASSPPLGTPSPEYLYKLDRFDEIRMEAEQLGCQVALIGGAGIDAAAGGVARERKDIDIAMLGGGPDALETLTARLTARGFQIRMRSSASQVKLEYQSHRLEIFRMDTDEQGAHHFISRNVYYRIGPDAITVGSLAGRSFPVLRPEYLLLMKRGMTAEATNLRLRSFLDRTRKYRVDLAAIRKVASPRLARKLEASGVFETIRIKRFRLAAREPTSDRSRPLTPKPAT